MKSLWNEQESQDYKGDLGLRVYTSRLLGRDPTLVLHGGGNTSVKVREKNILGHEEDILYVKGSGWDLISIEAAGFAPVRMNHLLELARLPKLSDLQMVNELRTHMTNANAPTPSVEAILHAIIPYKYVDHTHANSIVTITNTADGLKRIKEIFAYRVVIIPYIMPGFDLARLCAERFSAEANENTMGMVLLNHGIFSFANTAQESYENMIELVNEAEEYLQKNNAWNISITKQNSCHSASERCEIAKLRSEASRNFTKPMILSCHNSENIRNFINTQNIEQISQQGPATPDHVIRTKRLPLIGRNIDAYIDDYKSYFKEHAATADKEMTMLDPVPRIIIDPELGLCTLGQSIKDADIVADIYGHTLHIILRAEMLGGYRALPAADIFDVEYWELEQAKLKKSGTPPMFTGEIALVTGAASGIGKACVSALLKRGAAVIAIDINPEIESLFISSAYLGMTCDITDRSKLDECLNTGIRRFGGLDMLVLNAGMFPGGKRIEALDDQEWHKVMGINLDINLTLLRECHPLLKLAPNGGRVLIVGSKNVPAPGPGAAAYSTSKAALNQLARVAALEWGQDNIRINTLHPDAVFDTGIWSDDILETRAKHYNMTVHQYKTKNVLKTEIISKDVAELACEMCGPLFAKTTGAQIPIDGGNDRVI